MCKGMLVRCTTENFDVFGLGVGHCMAIFEVASRKQGTVVRKLLFSLLPSNCHSSVGTVAWTKQRFIEWKLDLSIQAGLPLCPIRWFACQDKLPERFEDLQVSPEARQSFQEELQEVLRQKPPSYWGGYRSFFIN